MLKSSFALLLNSLILSWGLSTFGIQLASAADKTESIPIEQVYDRLLGVAGSAAAISQTQEVFSKEGNLVIRRTALIDLKTKTVLWRTEYLADGKAPAESKKEYDQGILGGLELRRYSNAAKNQWFTQPASAESLKVAGDILNRCSMPELTRDLRLKLASDVAKIRAGDPKVVNPEALAKLLEKAEAVKEGNWINGGKFNISQAGLEWSGSAGKGGLIELLEARLSTYPGITIERVANSYTEQPRPIELIKMIGYETAGGSKFFQADKHGGNLAEALKGRALYGFQVDAIGNELVVIGVAPGTAADVAGVKIGDVLVSVGRQEVKVGDLKQVLEILTQTQEISLKFKASDQKEKEVALAKQPVR